MAFRLRPDESARDGLQRLARKELKSAAEGLAQRRQREEAIHNARRCIKKVRAILDVLNEDHAAGLGKERKRLKNVSRWLSPLRDADAIVETFDRVRRRSPRALPARVYGQARRELLASKKRVLADAHLSATLKKVRRTLRKTRRSTGRWRSQHKRFAMLTSAVRTARHDGLIAMKRARLHNGAAEFHEWRKLVKTLWYELRLLEDCGPAVRADIRTLRRIEQWLGEDHNVATLCATLLNETAFGRVPEDFEAFQTAARRYQETLRRSALERGKAFYGGSPTSYVARLRQSWRRWRESS